MSEPTAREHRWAATAELVRSAWAETLGEPPGEHSFLAAGGHSLAAARLIARLRDTTDVELSLAAVLRDDPTPAELIARLTGEAPAVPVASTPPAVPVPITGGIRSAPVPPHVRRIWAWHRIHPDSPAYHVVRVLRVEGRIEPAPLRAALADLARRHEALRSRVVEPRPVRPEFVVAVEPPPVPVTVELVELDELSAAAYRIAARALPLNDAPLWRIGVLYAPEANRTWLVLVMHHVIADLRASDVVLADLVNAYDARLAGEAPQFGAPAPSLIEHLLDAATRADDARVGRDLDWWAERLADAVPYMPLPLAGQPVSLVAEGQTATIDPAAANALDASLRGAGMTPAGFFLTAVAAVVSTWSGDGQPEVLGLPSVRVGRTTDTALVGFALDTLALPVRVDPDEPFRQAYDRIRDAFTEAVDHAAPPFDSIVERMRLPRHDRSPYLRVWFNDLTQAGAPRAMGGHPAGEHDLRPAWAIFDLGFYLRRDDEGYRLHLVTPAGLFDPADAVALLRQVMRVGAAAAENPSRPLWTNLTRDAAGPGATTVEDRPSTLELVRRYAQADPSRPAIVDNTGEVSYAQLAACLPAAVATAPVVPVLARRDAAYVQELLRATGARQAIVDESWPAVRREMATATAKLAGAGSPGHILFTSGTTGEPLAVQVTTRVLDAALDDLREMLALGRDDRVSFLSGPAHDPALRDMGLALRSGATLHVPPPDVMVAVARIADWLREHRVTVVNLTPMLAALAFGLCGEPLPDLRLVICGGAPLPAATVATIRAAAPAATVVNGYGCTETPQLVTMAAFAPGDPVPDPVPAGAPLPGRRVVIRDARGQPCDVGQLGEVFVADPYLADGYVNDAAPAARFGTDADGVRWFATGDLGRWDGLGRLHLSGRRDRQVLVNGHRLALDGVESLARRIGGVAEALAEVVGGAGGETVRLWLQPGPGQRVDAAAVRTALANLLPAAAVPTQVRVVSRLELSTNLKPVAPAEHTPTVASRAPVDERLRQLAESVLGQPVEPQTNFFEAGFTSLSLLQLCAELSDALGIEVPPLALFQHPNLAALSAHLGPDDPPLARVHPEGSPTVHSAPPPAPRARPDRIAVMRAQRRRVRERISGS